MPFETLAEFEFNVSHSMGDILFDMRHLDSVPAIRDVFGALFDDEALSTELQSQNLWMLWQRRNLIVHRRGVVDRQYLSKTGDTQPLQARLSVTAFEIEDYLKIVRDIGLKIFECGHNVLS